MEEEKKESLIDEEEEFEDLEDFIEIYSYGSELNAISFKAALNAMGIDVILRKIGDTMFPGAFDAVRMAVRVHDVEKAKKIIEEILNDQSKPVEDEEIGEEGGEPSEEQ